MTPAPQALQNATPPTFGVKPYTWRIMGLSKYGYKYFKWGYK